MTAHKNFSANTIGEYLKQYTEAVEKSLKNVDVGALEKAFQKIKSTLENGRHVYVAGNGGSAAIANHLCCDFSKGTYLPSEPSLKTHSLSANVSLLTALGNDMGYEEIFSHQLRMFAQKGDAIILISSSGNSPNIIRAAKLAREIQVTTIGMTGFSGGDVVSLLDVHLHISVSNFGVVEDCHQSLMHVLAQFINQVRGKSSAQ